MLDIQASQLRRMESSINHISQVSNWSTNIRHTSFSAHMQKKMKAIYPVKYLLDFNSWNFGRVLASLIFECPDEWWIVSLSKCGVETLHRMQLYLWMCTAHVCMYNSVYLQCRQMGSCLLELHSRLKRSYNIDPTGWITVLVQVLKILEKLILMCCFQGWRIKCLKLSWNSNWISLMMNSFIWRTDMWHIWKHEAYFMFSFTLTILVVYGT